MVWKASSFLSQEPGPLLQSRRREKGALVQTRVPEAASSIYLKEKPFCGAHRRHAWPQPPTICLCSVGEGVGSGPGEISHLGKPELRAFEIEWTLVLLSSGFPDGLHQLPGTRRNPSPEVPSLPRCLPRRPSLQGASKATARLEDDRGPKTKVHNSQATRIVQRKVPFVLMFHQSEKQNQSFS